MAYNAVTRGAAGVNMGRNIFQSEAPRAMMRAVHQVVHKQMKPNQAYELFLTLQRDEPKTSQNAPATTH